MGLGPSIIHSVTRLRKAGHFLNAPHVIEIGTQQLSDPFLRSRDILSELYAAFGLARAELGKPHIEDRPAAVEAQSQHAPPAEFFWRSLGFNYLAIDYASDGRCTLGLDLNRGSITGAMNGCADLVVNAGTTEHVANQDNAFRIIHDLAKVGGIMFHELPCSGYFTHGLVNYTPKMFWYLSRENGYRVIYISVHYDGDIALDGDVLVSNELYSGDYSPLAQPLPKMVPGFSITAVLQKQSAAAYVTPLDLVVT